MCQQEDSSTGSTEVFESTKSSNVAIRPSSVRPASGVAHLRARQSRQYPYPDVEAEAKTEVEADGARPTAASARWLASRVQQQQEDQVQELASNDALIATEEEAPKIGRSIHVFCPEQISVALVEAIGGPE